MVWGSRMFKIQSKYNSVLHKVILVVVSMVSNFVYADQQTFIYVSDITQEQSNSEREIWQYQYEVPLAYRNKNNSFQVQYTYKPPTQKIGSNPISNPQHRRQFSINNNADNQINVAGKIYNYPPSVQKINSNPFIKPSKQYVNSNKVERFLSYHGIFAIGY